MERIPEGMSRAVLDHKNAIGRSSLEPFDLHFIIQPGSP